MIARINAHCLLLEDGETEIKIPLRAIFEGLSAEDRHQMAEAITWDAIEQEAMDRLAGQSECWSSEDDTLRLQFLARVEAHLLSGRVWSALGHLDAVAKNITCHEHLYWLLWHDESTRNWFPAWAKAHGVESNYTHDLPDYAALRKLVEDALAALKGGEK